MGRNLWGGERLERAGGHRETGWTRSTWLREVHPEDSVMVQKHPGRHQIAKGLTFAWALTGGGTSIARICPAQCQQLFNKFQCFCVVYLGMYKQEVGQKPQ